MRESLPPCLSSDEHSRTVSQSGPKWSATRNSIINVNKALTSETPVRLVRKHCVRLVESNPNHANEESSFQLAFSVDNTRVYHEVELQSIDLENDDAMNVSQLIEAYPKFIKAEDLDFGDDDSKLELVLGLYEKAVLITENML